jgi:hypothetical protein
MTNTTNNIGCISWAIRVSKDSYSKVVSLKDWRLSKRDILLRDWAIANLSEDKPYIIATSAEIADIYKSCGNTKMERIERVANDNKKYIWRINAVMPHLSLKSNGRMEVCFEPVR